MEYVYSAGIMQKPHAQETDSLDVSLLSMLNKQQQHALTNLVRVADPATKQKVIIHNLGLVVDIAKRYSDHGVALFDLIREGNQGLIHALDSFEFESGLLFTNHVARCIRQSIECTIMNQIEPE